MKSSFCIFMMTNAVSHFKSLNYDYIYLGSVHEASSLYKLQFKGLEWFDENSGVWSEDLEELKGRIINLGIMNV